ncbi:MAG: ribose-phosphate diphosphokinase [Gammaproteobacteria bacterium]
MIAAVVSLSAGNELACSLADRIGCDYGVASVHEFPDGETGVRIDPALAEGSVLVVASLNAPNPKIIPLLFLSRVLRDYGAERVLLAAPYLAYMRQDTRFREGEGISAGYFADLVSAHFDGLVTVDTHLHRIRNLDEIYRIPALNVHAAPAVAEWVIRNVNQPLLIGPDSESEQWVAEAAGFSDMPWMVLEKIRRGDEDVEVSIPDAEPWRAHTPVLVDDIISTGGSMAAIIRHLQRAGMKPPVCVAVHGIFAGNAEEELIRAGASHIATTNTVEHTTNEIDISAVLLEGIYRLPKICTTGEGK